MARSAGRDNQLVLTPTLAAAARDLDRSERLDKSQAGELDLQLGFGETDLWLVVGWRKPGNLALRVAHAPAGMSLDDWEATADGWRARLKSALGTTTVEVGCTGDVVGYGTTLEPSEPVKFP